MKKYKVELNYPLDPNVESYLYHKDVYIIENPAPDYGVIEIWVETKIHQEQLENLIDIKRIIE